MTDKEKAMIQRRIYEDKDWCIVLEFVDGVFNGCLIRQIAPSVMLDKPMMEILDHDIAKALFKMIANVAEIEEKLSAAQGTDR